TGDLPWREAEKYAALLKAISRADAALPTPQRGLAMCDGTTYCEHVHIRGNPKTLGDEVPPRLPQAVAGKDQAAPQQGSGRLDLARRLPYRPHPPVPPGMANPPRMHHFGQGRGVPSSGLCGSG